MKNSKREARNYSTIKQIYRENYLEDITHRLRKEAENEKGKCS